MVWEWSRSGSSQDLSRSGTVETASTSAPPTGRATEEFCCELLVERGDWLHDISRRHNVDLRSLLEANPTLQNPDSLIAGSRLRVPCSRLVARSSPAESPRAKVPIAARKDASMSTSDAQILTLNRAMHLLGQFLWNKDRDYRVVEGDSLEWLAEKFGTTVMSIKRLNNLQDDTICTGSTLKIQRSRAFEQQTLLGRKANVPERNAAVEGLRLDTSFKTLMSLNPMFRVRLQLQKNKRLKSLTPQTVRVQYGDTLADIAYAHGLTIRDLQGLNHLRDDVIFEGDVLAVTSGFPKKELMDLRRGLRRTNRPLFSRQIHGGLGVGGPQPPLRTKTITSDGVRAEGQWKRRKKGFQLQEKWMRFTSPISEGFISSPYGWRWGAFHEGVDLAASQGAPILASDKGTVTFAGWSGGYGYLITIQHEGGFMTRYAHCCAIHARVGQQVVRGQHVAAVGSTGHATGPHLHFEVRRNGEALDPLKWVNL